MNKKIFDKTFLVDDLDLPYNDEIIKVNEVVDTSRWSIIYELIFEHDGKFWRTSYSVGATESQDESAWEYDSTVECVEVELKEVVTKQWKTKED